MYMGSIALFLYFVISCTVCVCYHHADLSDVHVLL